MRRFSNAYVSHFLEQGCRVGLYCAKEIRLQKSVDAAELWPGKKDPVIRGLLEWDRLKAPCLGKDVTAMEKDCIRP